MNENGATLANGGDFSKKSRESRLMNRVNSPVSIKIEDDSDGEDQALANQVNSVNIHSSNTGSSNDKYVQTEDAVLQDMLRKIVQERMLQYEAAALKDQCIDKQLSPLLEKLQRENEELRIYGNQLKLQLDQKEQEKQTLKRRFEQMNNGTQQQQQQQSLVPTTFATPMPLRNIRPLRPRPPNMVLPQTVTALPRGPVPPMRQVVPQPGLMRHPFGQTDRFMTINNNFVNGRNTQVVPSNQAQGLRIASMPPETVVVRPSNEVQNTNQQQFMQRMPIRQPAPQQLQRSPLASVVRPVLQQQQQQQQQQQKQQSPRQNVPNLALPFSPLPKLTASISTSNNAIVLTWDYHDKMTEEQKEQIKVECYQLFAHQAKEAHVAPPKDTKQWKKIGVVNALPLPMACTLTQFASGSVYFFAVVAVDIHGREGELSNHCVIRLDINGQNNRKR